jgi:predicted nuclease of predicted toxin-antitoxin system
VRFYLDEHLSPEIAQIARGLGLDVVSALEVGPPGLSDEQQLDLAAREERCLVTRDRRDFIRLTLLYFESLRSHAGVLLLPISLQTNQFSGIARALAAYAQQHADADLHYLVDYL